MAINESNIKLLASQVMDDVPEGGGAPTSIEIVDGVSNAIFSDISPLDRAGGNVSLRKVVTHVQTLTTDTYAGATAILTAPPQDPRVSVMMFTTNDIFDRRTSARDRVEAYLFGSSTWGGFLFENHIAGQRVIQIFQRVGAELPAVGKTLVLVQDEGTVSEKKQYVRTTRVSAVTRKFTRTIQSSGDLYDAVVVTCEISDTLRYDFLGSPSDEFFNRAPYATRVRDTNVADAAKYYGVAPLTAPMTLGALTANVASVFSSLVPSAQTEIPIVDSKPNGAAAIPTAAGEPRTITRNQAFDSTHAISIGQSVLAGSLSIATGSITITDAGGKLFAGTTEVGIIDYSQGILQILATSAASYGSTKTITYTPASLTVRDLQTVSWSVTAESRSGTIVGILSPLPAAGTATISYRSQGKWYSLFDDGAGRLKGVDAAFGSGNVNYITGSVILTMGALPDVGSKVIMTYGLVTTEVKRSGAVLSAFTEIQLTNTNIAPGTVTLTWDDGTVRTVTDSAGTLTGYGTGTIDYIKGKIKLVPTTMPSVGAQIACTYSYGAPLEVTFTGPARIAGGYLELQLPHTNIMPRSILMEWNTEYNDSDIAKVGTVTAESHLLGFVPINPQPPTPILRGGDPIITLYDDGAGGFSQHPECLAAINYTAGIVKFLPEIKLSMPCAQWGKVEIGRSQVSSQMRIGAVSGVGITETITSRDVFTGYTYKDIGANFVPLMAGYVKVKYRTTAAGTSVVDELHGSNFKFDLTPSSVEPIVAGSVSFSVGASFYIERQGVLYKDPDIVTGSGVIAGSVDYSNGVVNLSAWTAGAAPTATVLSMVTSIGTQPTDSVTFRTAVAPLRPSSVLVQYVLVANPSQTVSVATSNANGVLIGDKCFGTVDYETGVIEMVFGERIIAAGNEAEYWYNAANVGPDGKILKPAQVFADTIRYAAVGYSYLPLDANILGVDPVRLPQDGRVPIYRTGGYVVVGHETSTAPATVANAQVVDLARVRLARVKVVGNNGVTITSGYTTNLDAGTVTFTDVTGYSQPVKIYHRIEDLVMVSDVQINGALAFTSPITHDFPLGSYISSALVLGNLKARVPVLRDQETWTGVFSDIQIGNAAPGTYNDVLAPVEVTNKGTITERWAIRFTNTNTFEVIGEHVGVIATGNTATDLSPVNPASGVAYFTLRAIGWGSGWNIGNVLRMDTVGAMSPIWVVRTVQQGPETVSNDYVTLLINGGIDRP